MTRNRNLKALLSGVIVLAVLAGAAWTASAQVGTAGAAPAQEQVRERIQERIRSAQGLNDGERTEMRENLEACVRAGVTDPGLESVFPRTGKARQVSTAIQLRLQGRVRAMAQDGLPVEPVLAKLQEALTKGVPEAGLSQVAERIEQHVRAAKRIMTQARADGVKPAVDGRRERQMLGELAQQMWRGTSAQAVETLLGQARTRTRTRACTTEDLVASSETATRLREEGVEAGRALRVVGEALRQGYGAPEMRKLQYMMVYRHREGRGVKGLVDDFEHCLGSGMDAARMYQYMMQHGWMGPGDVQGPGGSRPIDDQGRGRGTPGGTGSGSDLRGGTGGSSTVGGGTGSSLGTGDPKGGR